MLNIKTDSRKIIKGDIFVAIKGLNNNGHDYIVDAIKNGAAKVVAEYGDYEVETKIVADTKKWLEEYLATTYKTTLDSMTFIAITGTNGKTTTAYLTYQLLNKLGKKCAYIGTNGFYINNKLVKELNNTVPEITEMYSLILESYENNCNHLVMEVSSHALIQRRIAGIKYDIAAFTNLTQDHLDYHKTMEEYLHAKLNLLNYLKNNGIFITNIDDSYGNKFLGLNTKEIGFNARDYQILTYQNLSHTTLIKFKYKETIYQVETNLISKFNIYNYLTALAIVCEIGFDIEKIINITKDIYPPKGRCEIIPINSSKVVIDYAHTPDAVEKIISAFNEIKEGKLITIIGCGGDRDPIKRPIMGNIATRLSDYVIFTNDNPRTEDDKKIMNDILAGVTKDNYEIEFDRRLAIHRGIDLLKEKDTLLLLGKGHEDYQIIGKEKISFDDCEEVNNYIKQNEI